MKKWIAVYTKSRHEQTVVNELNKKINHNIRTIFSENFTNEKLCLYYYNLFRNLNEIGEA